MKHPSRVPAERAVTAEDYRRMFAHARDAYCVTGADGLIVQANEAALSLLGYADEELYDLRLPDLLLDDADRARVAHALMPGSDLPEQELRLQRKDGPAVVCLAAAYPRSDGRGGFLIALHDVTEHRRTQQQLIHSAFHDVLTGLPNRLLFMDRLERVLKHARRRTGYRFAVLFLDLDRFKLVNDTFGHAAGDELLQAVSRRLEQCLRDDDSVARLGGDEFAIIVDAINDASDATRVAERILESLREAFPVQGREAHVTASIGIALSTSGYDTPDDVLRDADAAMYRAKHSGRAHYEIFDLEMHRRAQSQLQLESDLRHAVARGEFAVHYQPVIALDGGTVIGLEALVRWTHPKRGTLLPGEFIAVAEQTGAIIDIGWYVLREACRQLQTWRERYPRSTVRLTMSVNLSARQFVQPDLLRRIDQILDETGLDPACLRLELTESAVTFAPDVAREVLGELRNRGIQICLDDFGTGYSSLQQLKQLPLSNVKVDRSFVRDLGTNIESQGMVQTIVALGNSLCVDTIAEGVETPEELDELRALGMKFAQGYLFSIPLAPELAEQLLSEG
ncbi:MAG: putative bifunctional diguanylate cyclase/phosphodiesterase [Longimicrobiales bacterium]